jgi:prepilin-type N-terminal cleavage/methylation domain-containing protein
VSAPLAVGKPHSATHTAGFTLIELLVVVSVLIVLGSLAFPAVQSALDRAKKVQAKNDLVQVVAAINAYRSEYGKYPVSVASGTSDAFFGTGTAPTGATSYGDNEVLINVLRSVPGSNAAVVAALNPRQITFLSARDVKSQTKPLAGVAQTGRFYDPWGAPYEFVLDTNYDEQLPNPYSDTDSSAGATTLRIGAIGYALGKNGAKGGGAAASAAFAKEPGTAGRFKDSGDVISWQ